jgi:hypothetical protein
LASPASALRHAGPGTRGARPARWVDLRARARTYATNLPGVTDLPHNRSNDMRAGAPGSRLLDAIVLCEVMTCAKELDVLRHER